MPVVNFDATNASPPYAQVRGTLSATPDTVSEVVFPFDVAVFTIESEAGGSTLKYTSDSSVEVDDVLTTEDYVTIISGAGPRRFKARYGVRSRSGAITSIMIASAVANAEFVIEVESTNE